MAQTSPEDTRSDSHQTHGHFVWFHSHEMPRGGTFGDRMQAGGGAGQGGLGGAQGRGW